MRLDEEVLMDFFREYITVSVSFIHVLESLSFVHHPPPPPKHTLPSLFGWISKRYAYLLKGIPIKERLTFFNSWLDFSFNFFQCFFIPIFLTWVAESRKQSQDTEWFKRTCFSREPGYLHAHLHEYSWTSTWLPGNLFC